MFPQKELEEVEFHLQLKVQEEAHPMVHPIHQKKAEEANQQVGLLQEERVRGSVPSSPKEGAGGRSKGGSTESSEEAKWVVIQVSSMR